MAELAKLLPYCEHNYGGNHPLTSACRAGDVAAFLLAAARITYNMDIGVATVADRLSA